MANKQIPLEFDKFFHIYNRANNRDNLFIENKNYSYFMMLFEKHLSRIADLYVYCLLPNHFHFLLKIKTVEEIMAILEAQLIKLDSELDALFLSWQFSIFFNAYSKAINMMYKRNGSLFQKRFGRIKIDTDDYLAQLIYYIHSNPYKHKVCNDFQKYPYSSYQLLIGEAPTILKRNELFEFFGGREAFIRFHEEHRSDLDSSGLTLE